MIVNNRIFYIFLIFPCFSLQVIALNHVPTFKAFPCLIVDRQSFFVASSLSFGMP